MVHQSTNFKGNSSLSQLRKKKEIPGQGITREIKSQPDDDCSKRGRRLRKGKSNESKFKFNNSERKQGRASANQKENQNA